MGDSPQHIRGHRLGQEELGTGRAGGSTAQGLTCHFGAVTVADTAVEDIQLFCTAGHENLSVQCLQGGLRGAQLTARALRSVPSRKIWALTFPPPQTPLPLTCASLGKRKERYHIYPAMMIPTGLGVGLAHYSMEGAF